MNQAGKHDFTFRRGDTLWQAVLSAYDEWKPFMNRNIPSGSEEEKESNRKKVKLHDALIKYAEALK